MVTTSLACARFVSEVIAFCSGPVTAEFKELVREELGIVMTGLASEIKTPGQKSQIPDMLAAETLQFIRDDARCMHYCDSSEKYSLSAGYLSNL